MRRTRYLALIAGAVLFAGCASRPSTSSFAYCLPVSAERCWVLWYEGDTSRAELVDLYSGTVGSVEVPGALGRPWTVTDSTALVPFYVRPTVVGTGEAYGWASLDSNTCRLKWKRCIAGPKAAVVDVDGNSLVEVAGDPGVATCIDLDTGHIRWQSELQARANGGIRLMEQSVIVGGTEHIVALDRVTGQRVQEFSGGFLGPDIGHLLYTYPKAGGLQRLQRISSIDSSTLNFRPVAITRNVAGLMYGFGDQLLSAEGAAFNSLTMRRADGAVSWQLSLGKYAVWNRSIGPVADNKLPRFTWFTVAPVDETKLAAVGLVEVDLVQRRVVATFALPQGAGSEPWTPCIDGGHMLLVHPNTLRHSTTVARFDAITGVLERAVDVPIDYEFSEPRPVVKGGHMWLPRSTCMEPESGLMTVLDTQTLEATEMTSGKPSSPRRPAHLKTMDVTESLRAALSHPLDLGK